jgi:hypothetical protein
MPLTLMEKLDSRKWNTGDNATAEMVYVLTGTFNAAALLGLQAGGMEDRIANATERMPKGVEGLRRDVKNNRAEFV